jgi:hypothetical protein
MNFARLTGVVCRYDDLHVARQHTQLPQGYEADLRGLSNMQKLAIDLFLWLATCSMTLDVSFELPEESEWANAPFELPEKEKSLRFFKCASAHCSVSSLVAQAPCAAGSEICPFLRVIRIHRKS